MKKLSIKDELTDFLLYSAPEGNIKVEVILNDETVWLTQNSIAHLFGVQVPAISKHLKNIFESGELDKDSAISILETVQEEGGYTNKVTDIFAECSIDYDPKSDITKDFYAIVQKNSILQFTEIQQLK